MDSDLPFHYRIPYHCAGSQRIGIVSKLVRPLRTRQQFPNAPLTVIHQPPILENDAQQWRRPVMI